MTDQPILVNGAWQAAASPTGSFQATNPATKEQLPHSYPVSSWDELQAMLDAASGKRSSPCARHRAVPLLIFWKSMLMPSKRVRMRWWKRPTWRQVYRQARAYRVNWAARPTNCDRQGRPSAAAPG